MDDGSRAMHGSGHKPLVIGILLFPDVTQLDLTGAFEPMARAPNTQVLLVAKEVRDAMVRSDLGLRLVADCGLHDCPDLDVLCVPGGPGQIGLMADDEVLSFIRRQASASVRYVTSVCTGALVLGAAGVLCGVRATTHWMSIEFLSAFGAIAAPGERVVRDTVKLKGGREVVVMTGGGITAGIDFGLALVAEVFGVEVAERIQLQLEYYPQPPLPLGIRGGDPSAVAPEVRDAVCRAAQSMLERRRKANQQAAARMEGLWTREG